jgi:biopolymer transport protein ExbD
MKIQQPPMKKARIEIIPMIDAIFFLLVFFMYSSLSMVKVKGVNVALPTDRAAAQEKNKAKAKTPAVSKLVVSVTDKGEYYINRRKVDSKTIQANLQSDVTAHPSVPVVVNVAKSQSTQNLINVMDSLNRIATADGKPLQVLIATEPVDLDGNALPAGTNAKTAKAPR